MLLPMSEAGDPALIGRRIAGKFVVEKFLGGGAMGAVYRARDGSLERNVALKVMHPAVAVDPSFVTRFHREARAASRLEHPNSMHVIEFGGEPDGLLYIAMEYLEGRDLYRVIHEDWPLPEERIADIMMKALGAMAAAHEMGVIHRDLKPENIMILNRKDDDGKDLVKVCDFGIAKITEKDDRPGSSPKTAGQKLTTAGLVVGTPEYMSPEQARGEKLDARSDLYSTGILLYQLLTGRTPFLAETALAVVLKHINEPPEAPSTIYPDVHKGLEKVCLRSISKKREDRFQSARDMRAAIRAAIEGRPMPVDGAHTATTSANVTSPSGPPDPRSGPPGPLKTAPMSPAVDGFVGTTGVVSPDNTSKMTPLGTAQASPTPEEKTRSRMPVLVAVALVALVVGISTAVYFGGGRTTAPTPAVTPSADPSVAPHPSASASETGKVDGPSPSSIDVRVMRPADTTPGTPPAPEPKSAKTPATSKNPGGADRASSPATPSSTSEPTPETPASPTPVGASAAPPASAPSAAPAQPAPKFSPASCHATAGAPKSNSSYPVKDFSIRNPGAAWTNCAKTTITAQPSGPISGTVHVRFNDNKGFKSATCDGCPKPLASCIASSTGSIVSVNFKSGDATGDPEFVVPLTVVCE
jgi:eukaryotic-like serine/threonine-protein kinase